MEWNPLGKIKRYLFLSTSDYNQSVFSETVEAQVSYQTRNYYSVRLLIWSGPPPPSLKKKGNFSQGEPKTLDTKKEVGQGILCQLWYYQSNIVYEDNLPS